MVECKVDPMSTEKVEPTEGDARLDRVFGALGDPSRRRIIALLREAGDLKVGDIATVFSMSLNGVSKHLKVLERAGLVLRRVEGREHWLCVDWEGLREAYQWLHFHRHFWGGRLDSLADYFQRGNFQSNEEKK